MKTSNFQFKSLTPWLIILLLAAACIAIILFLLKPQYDSFQQSRKARKAASDQLAVVNDELANLKNTVNQIESLSEGQRVTIDQAMPVGLNLEQLLNNLHKLAQSAGVVVVNLNISQLDEITTSETGEPLIQGIALKSNITMSVRARHPDFMKFVEMLENNARLIDIIDLSTSSFSQSDSLGLINAQINGIVYHLDGIPPEPRFPYGHSLDTTIFELPQFQTLRLSN